MKILRIYILKELIGPFFLALLVLTFVLLMGNIIKLADLIINKGVGISYVGRFLLFLIPSLLSYTIPMSVLTGTLLAFGRLASDNELQAMRANGINLCRVMIPVIIFGLILSLVSCALNDRVIPMAHFASRRLLMEIGARKPEAFLESGTFTKTPDGYIIFIYEIKGNELHHIRIYQPQEGRPTRTIVANRGEIIGMPAKKTLTLRLTNAVVDEPDPRDPASFVKGNFKSYFLTLNLSERSQAIGSIGKKPRDKTIDELRQEIKRLRKENVDPSPLLIEIHKKISLAFASLALVLIGLPLAIIARRGERSIGFGISFAIVILYYILLAGGTALASKGTLPVVVCMWSPNLLLAIVGIPLIYLTVER